MQVKAKIVAMILLVLTLAPNCRSQSNRTDETPIQPLETLKSPLKVGDIAPNFILEDLDGAKFELDQLKKGGNVVVVVLRGYPGYQCPLCTQQVSKFIQQSAEFAKSHTKVVFVYPGSKKDLKQHGKDFLKSFHLPEQFCFLLDPDFQFTTSYSLRWDAPMETAYPSTFAIDESGKVLFAKVSKSHGDRSEAAVVLRAIEKK